MAMKEEIKKKFIDILFEPEDEDDEPVVLTESKPEKRREENTVKASDILYHKSEKSAFINLDEKPKEIKETRTGGVYEFSTQISPIFGVLKGGESIEEEKKGVDETQINKPEDSHLEIITSPIYGYASKETVYKEETEEESVEEPYDEEELHRLLLNEDERYSRYDYDDDDIDLFNVFGDED